MAYMMYYGAFKQIYIELTGTGVCFSANVCNVDVSDPGYV